MPTGIAAARQALVISSAGVTMKRLLARHIRRRAAGSAARNAIEAAMASASSRARVLRRDAARRAPSCACARRAAAPRPRPASRARGTGSRRVRPTRPAACGRRSAPSRRRSRTTISASRSSGGDGLDGATDDADPTVRAQAHECRERGARGMRGHGYGLNVHGEILPQDLIALLRPACRPRLRAGPRRRRRSAPSIRS